MSLRSWAQYLRWRWHYRSYDSWSREERTFLFGSDYEAPKPAPKVIENYDIYTLPRKEREQIALESLKIYAQEPHPRMRAWGFERDSDFAL
jgi:hypothetical protein